MRALMLKKLKLDYFSEIKSSSDGFYLFSAQVLTIGISFISLLVTTRFLKIEVRGDFVTLSAFIGLVALAFDAGNGFAFSKAFARYKRQRHNLITVLYLIILAKFIFLGLFSFLIAHLKSFIPFGVAFKSELILIAFLASTNILFLSLITPIILIVRNLKSYGASLVLFSAAGFTGLSFSLIFFEATIKNVLLGQILFEFFALVLIIASVRFIFKRPTKIQKNLVIRIFSDGLFIWISSLSNFINSKSIIFIIALSANSTTIAIFSVVFAIMDKIWLIGDVLGTQLFKKQANQANFQLASLFESLKLNSGLVISINLLLFFSLPMILDVLFPAAYSSAFTYFLPMAIWSFFVSSWRIMWLVLNAYNTALASKINFIGAMVNIVILYVALENFNLAIGLYAFPISSCVCCIFGLKKIKEI